MRYCQYLIFVLMLGCRSAVYQPAPQADPQPPMPPSFPGDHPIAKALAVSLAVPVLDQGSHNAVLNWEVDPEIYVAGYHVRWGTASRSYTFSTNVPGRFSTNVVVTGLWGGVNYFFAADCYTTNNSISELSNEVQYTPPLIPPVLQSSNFTVTWFGPFDVFASRDMLNWDLIAKTDLNQITIPDEKNGILFLKVSTADPTFKLRIARSP